MALGRGGGPIEAQTMGGIGHCAQTAPAGAYGGHPGWYECQLGLLAVLLAQRKCRGKSPIRPNWATLQYNRIHERGARVAKRPKARLIFSDIAEAPTGRLATGDFDAPYFAEYIAYVDGSLIMKFSAITSPVISAAICP